MFCRLCSLLQLGKLKLVQVQVEIPNAQTQKGQAGNRTNSKFFIKKAALREVQNIRNIKAGGIKTKTWGNTGRNTCRNRRNTRGHRDDMT